MKKIDMDTHPRRAHFDYFNGLSNPYAGITVNVDITDFIRRINAQKQPFFHSFLYHVMSAANAVPEFRQRIYDGGIVEFESCPASYTLALNNGTYCYCRVDCNMPFDEFLTYAKARQAEAELSPSVEETEEESLPLIFITCTPWFSFTNILQPVPSPADSNPRISWGKYFRKENRTLIPVSILCNHAIVDGLHFAKFLDKLNDRLSPEGK